MKINFLISNFFLKLGFFIITPRNDSFGGFYGTLMNGFKIANYLKKKKIICINLIDYRNKFGQKKIFNLILVLRITKKLRFEEIVLSFLFSILILPFHILYYFKISSLLNLIFFRNFSNRFIPKFFGYGELFTNEKLENDYNFTYQLKLDPKLYLNNKVEFFKNNQLLTKKNIALCIKDLNYNKIKKISEVFCSDINYTKSSLDYLINNGFTVKRVGEPLMTKFNYRNKNFKDLTKSINHLGKFNSTIESCDFYFGSAASHAEAVELFNKKKCLINSIDHLDNSFSYSKKNVILFKKIFDIKKKKILSIEELFESNLFDHFEVKKKFYNKEIILIENDQNEILDSIKFFLKIYENSLDIYQKNKQYFEMRKLAVKKKIKNKSCSLLLSCEFNEYTVPENYLDQFLFRNKYIDELSNKFYLDNLKNYFS